MNNDLKHLIGEFPISFLLKCRDNCKCSSHKVCCQKKVNNVLREKFSKFSKSSKVFKNMEKAPLPRSLGLLSRLKGKSACSQLDNRYNPSSEFCLLPISFKSYVLEGYLNSGLLMLCGDIEANPGPQTSLSQVQSSHETTFSSGSGTTATASSGPTTASASTPAREGAGRPELQVTTLNVRGLSDSKKVRHLVNSCYKNCSKSNVNIFMFQETYVQSLKILDYIWRGEYHLTPALGNSVGCVTLLSAPMKIVYREDIGNRGHVLAVSKENVMKVEYILVNLYVPNGLDSSKVDFIDEAIQRVGEIQTLYNCSTVVLAGDLNIVFNKDEVKNRAYTMAENRMARSISNIFSGLELVDGWVKSKTKSFTWTSCRNGRQIFSTLDRVLFTETKIVLRSKTADWSLSLSDHAAVTALFDLPNAHAKQKSFIPRLDPTILEDPECTRLMNEVYSEMMANAIPTWDPHTSLEYCKLCIRTSANIATGKMKASYRDEEKILNEDINAVTSKIAEANELSPEYPLYLNKLEDLKALKRQFVERIGTKLERRTASKWYNEGELSNKYFFNLLSRRTNEEIDSLIVNDEVINDKNKIEDAVSTFYKDLYESVPLTVNNSDNFFQHIDPVDPQDVEALTSEITLEELANTLSECADSAPGPDGIPYSFLRHHWSSVGPILVKAWQYSLMTDNLAPSHKVSYLRLIPKAGKDTRVISNLRPITLSNTDHKLITKTYSKKLTAIVSNSIGQEQTAYIPGRLINDNVRAMLTTMDLAEIDDDVEGCIVSLDAKKAFDSVDHRYIARCLKAFGLERFIPIFKTLYRELSSDIILNGNIIKGFKILKGVKQGDALSCIIFIMCMEPLIRNIKHNAVIKPIVSRHLPVSLPKVYGFADDINAIVKATNNGVQEIFNEYQAFTSESGLVLNADKTEILMFNKQRQNERRFKVRYNDTDYEISAKEQIKINGIIFQQDLVRREVANVDKVINAMSKHLAQWSRRRLTLLGKILILKTYAISQVIYLMQSITLCDNSLKKINAVVYKFLWNKNFSAAKAPDRIKRSIIVTPVSQGGFGMLDLSDLRKSLDLRAYGRLMTSKHSFFEQIGAIVKNKGCFRIDVSQLAVDKKVKIGIDLINEQRAKALRWPLELIVKDLNLRLAIESTELQKVLTNAGNNSIMAFRARRRIRRIKLGQLTADEVNDLSRHFALPGLSEIMLRLLREPINVTENIPHYDIYPSAPGKVVQLSKVSSKEFRTNLRSIEEQVICLYKSGLTLQPGEVASWTGKIKRLTSSRHRNSVLRIAHGDVYTNDRLHRFGLVDNPACLHCNHPIENLIHRIIECPTAEMAWRHLNQRLSDLGLTPLRNINLENIMGAGDNLSKIELAIVSELALRLASGNVNATCPLTLVRNTLRTVAIGEKMATDLRRTMLN